MIEETILNIVEKVKFNKKEHFGAFLGKCIHRFHREDESDRESQRKHKSVVFKTDAFFKNFTSFQNEFGKDKIYLAGVEALHAICEELAIELEPEECFILYHLRGLGKFRMKEEKLYSELKGLWGQPQYKEFAIEDKQDFSAAIRALRDAKVVDYRRGNMTLNPTVIIRYR